MAKSRSGSVVSPAIAAETARPAAIPHRIDRSTPAPDSGSIAEAASPATKATPESLARIRSSLELARKWYAPRNRTDWSGHFYQYANRLAFHFFLKKQNGIPSRLVFVNFTNAIEVAGPASEAEWHGATRLLHAVLGLPKDLAAFGVYHAFVDARTLTNV